MSPRQNRADSMQRRCPSDAHLVHLAESIAGLRSQAVRSAGGLIPLHPRPRRRTPKLITKIVTSPAEARRASKGGASK
jgi:hypothetical protein